MNWSEVLAGENITAPAEAILSSTFNDTAEEAAPTMTWVPAASSRSTVALAVSVVVSPGVTGRQLHRLAQHTAVGVDLIDRELHTGRHRRAEEGEAAGLGEQCPDVEGGPC